MQGMRSSQPGSSVIVGHSWMDTRPFAVGRAVPDASDYRLEPVIETHKVIETGDGRR